MVFTFNYIELTNHFASQMNNNLGRDHGIIVHSNSGYSKSAIVLQGGINRLL